MHAITIMVGAAILWSLYPLFIGLAENQIGPALLVLMVHITCGLSAALFGLIKTRRKAQCWNNLKKVIAGLEFEHWLYLVLVGLASTLYNFCFIYAMEIGSKTATAIIIEGWPILAIFLAPILITKTWKKVTSADYLAAFIALLGVSLIVFEDSASLLIVFENTDALDASTVLGALVALMGGLCLAASIVLGSEVSNVLSNHILEEKNRAYLVHFGGKQSEELLPCLHRYCYSSHSLRICI